MESSYIYARGLRVHYLHWNLAGAGPAVVLLHGLASNARIWELTAPFLAERDFRVFAPDGRGHGLTDKPDGDYGFETFSYDLLAFLEALNLERPLLAGHSWGGHRILDYAARYPVGPRAPAGIVLVDGGVTQLDDFNNVTWETIRDRLAPPKLAGMPLESFMAMLTAPGRAWTPDEIAQSIILANFELGEDDTLSPQLTYDRHMQIVRALWDIRTYDLFAKIRCPALAIPARMSEPLDEGNRQFIQSKEKGLEKIRQIRPAVQVEWMNDTIHDIPLQRPRELAESITRFAASISAKGRS
jgi:pimeloyl-ACP methyl ester carboxylesterase